MARVEAWLGGAKPARCSRLSPARASALPDWVGPHFGGGAKEYPARVRVLLRFSRAGFHFSPPPHLLNDLVNYSQFGGQRAKEPPPPKKTPIPSLTAPGSTLKCCIQANHCARDFRRNPDAPARPSGAKKKVQFDWPGVRRTRSSSHAQRQFRLTELSQEAGSGAKPWRRWLGLGRGEGREGERIPPQSLAAKRSTPPSSFCCLTQKTKLKPKRRYLMHLVPPLTGILASDGQQLQSQAGEAAAAGTSWAKVSLASTTPKQSLSCCSATP